MSCSRLLARLEKLILFLTAASFALQAPIALNLTVLLSR
jgi:hypothetical protein